MAFVPAGVIPAVLLPFADNLEIDEKSFRSHLRDVASTDGISAVTVNAHSTEVASCSFEEQRRVMEMTADEIGDRLPIVHGVWADGSLEAARIARAAAAGHASAVESGEAFGRILRHATRGHRRLEGALGVFGLDAKATCLGRVRRLLDADRPLHPAPG